jgi:hypothetical protein
MRIFGIVVLILGISSELLFTIACLGGSEVSLTAFGVGALLIVSGWRLRTYGRGIGQRKASSARATGHVPHSWTIELSLTPAVAALISREMSRSRRLTAIIIAAGMSFFLLFGAITHLTVSSPAGISVFPFMAAASLGFGLVVGGIYILLGQRPARRDLRESTCFRTSGPVQLVPVFGGYLLKLIDTSFLLNNRAAAAAITKLTWATVEYTKHAHLIFEIRDYSGQSVYRLPGYEGECSLQGQITSKNLAGQLVQCTVEEAFTMFFEPWLKRRTAIVIFLSSDQEGSRTRITVVSRKEQTVSIQLAYGEAEFNLKGATLSYGNSEIDGEYANCKGKCGLLIVQLSQRTSQLVFAEPAEVAATALATVSGQAVEAWALQCGLIKD